MSIYSYLYVYLQPVLSEWIKWDDVDRGDGIIRSSGSVCGTDPKYVDNTLSVV